MDGITLSVIRCEIERYLPLKVQRIQQPGRRELAFTLFGPRLRERLVMSLEGNTPFFGFSSERRDNPATPSGFCLALRKRLEGGNLTGIRQQSVDRVLYLDFTGRDDLGNVTFYVLTFDMAGRGRNIGLFKEDLLEIAMLPLDEDRFVRGSPYTPPAGSRLDLGGLDGPEPESHLARILLSGDGAALDVLGSAVEGVGKELALSLLATACQKPSVPFSPEGAGAVSRLLTEIARVIRHETPHMAVRPAVYLSPKGPGVVFHVLPLAHLPVALGFASVLEGAGEFRKMTLGARQLAALRTYAEGLCRRLLKKVESRHDAQVRDLEASSDPGRYRVWAELIDSSGQRRPPGASGMTVIDYYKDPPAEVSVPLDPRYSSRDNARNYYRIYTKLTRAQKVLEESVRNLEASLGRLTDMRSALDEAAGAGDLERIIQKLETMAKAEGLAVRNKGIRPGGKSSQATHARRASAGIVHQVETVPGPDGAMFFVGGDAKQNDYLVTRVRRPGDVWFHAKGQKGAHVLARPPAGCAAPERLSVSPEPSRVSPARPGLTDAAVLAAARLAAERSAACGAPKVEVDYVDASRVRKPRGAAPGFVTYTGQKTIVTAL